MEDAGRTTFLGIAGGTASGKTTLALRLRERLGAEARLLGMDCYYRGIAPGADPSAVDFDDPAALDWPLLRAQVRDLLAGRSVAQPIYCFSTHCRLAETERLDPAPILILEGLHALHDPELRRLMDLRVFVDAPADVRLSRRIDRDVRERGRTAESVRRQYETTVRPMHDRFVAPAKAHADLVVEIPRLELLDTIAEDVLRRLGRRS